MSEKINLLFPVETINRELDFRLFFACLSARADRRIWIGQSRVIYSLAHAIQGGVYVGKNLWGLPPNLTWNRYHNLKNQGYKCVHLDEEGAVHYGETEQWKAELSRRFDPTQLQPDDYVCTWGDFQRDYYLSLDPPCAGNIHSTGHPRFDLYKPAFRDYYATDAQKLRERYGDFVLINTNFSQVNHHSGPPRIFSERWGYRADDPQKRLDFFDRWRHLSFTLTNFVRLTNRLSVEFPHINIVLRPHPSENQNFYRAAFDGVPNVHVTREGSVGPWLFACRAMIHDGCTTGLEAHFGGVHVINYKSVEDTAHDLYLPNVFGARCTSDEAVMDEVHASLKNKRAVNSSVDAAVSPPVPGLACALLENLRSDAFQRLGTVLDEVVASMDVATSAYTPGKFALREGLRSYGRRVKQNLLRRSREPGRERMGKFYGFEGVDLDERLERVQTVTKTRIKYTVHSGELVSIEL
ncbi:MAG TPA: surface carbohydrate biosynthesis protein [Abditibacteriaceae bacterium]|jgi:surface carbohydrate biosynthesis protein